MHESKCRRRRVFRPYTNVNFVNCLMALPAPLLILLAGPLKTNTGTEHPPHTPRKTNQLFRRCHPYARKSASQAVLRRTQLTLHATRRTPHGDSRLVLAVSAWSVKTRHTPSRHCRDARVYDHMTTAMHDVRTPPLPSPPLPS